MLNDFVRIIAPREYQDWTDWPRLDGRVGQVNYINLEHNEIVVVGWSKNNRWPKARDHIFMDGIRVLLENTIPATEEDWIYQQLEDNIEQ